MSPINVSVQARTPKTIQTPYRTPKSVKRGAMESSDRIFGTPDYLAPELLRTYVIQNDIFNFNDICIYNKLL